MQKNDFKNKQKIAIFDGFLANKFAILDVSFDSFGKKI